jgi:hypothetical protein
MNAKQKIVLIGPLPPPYHGSINYFQSLLNSKVKELYDVIHLDTSDHRTIDNIAKFDLTNVYLALKNIIHLVAIVLQKKPSLVYLTIAANPLAFFRDGLFILTTSVFSRAKIVVHLHRGMVFRDTFYRLSNFVVMAFIRVVLTKVDTGIVLGHSVTGAIDGFVKTIKVVPNGIPVEKRPDL